MSSPRGRAAPGRAERRDGRRRSASIPWRRGRAGEVESERVSSRGGRERVEAGDWRGERWRSSRRGLAAGGRGWMDPWGCQVTAFSPQAADFSRYSAPIVVLPAATRAHSPCSCSRGGRRRRQRLGDRAARPRSLASRALQACTATRSRGYINSPGPGSSRFLERALESGPLERKPLALPVGGCS